jgi:hypothetical protein
LAIEQYREHHVLVNHSIDQLMRLRDVCRLPTISSLTFQAFPSGASWEL